MVGIVHAETSTGAQQPMDGLGKLCHEHGALLVVDTVTSLGGVPVEVDAWEVDAVYSGTQKCLCCPPGLAPVTFSPRALDAVRARKTKVQSWYLDAGMIADYWGRGSASTTTPRRSAWSTRCARRCASSARRGCRPASPATSGNAKALMAGLAALGAKPLSKDGERLPSLNA